mgnify:CR=1 FL=1
MSDLFESFAISGSGMKAQSTRLRHVAENLANADTPGYRRKLTPFREEMHGGRTTGGVQAAPVRLDRSELPQVFDPAHPMAGEDGFYLGSNVDMVIEIADAREAKRSYEANLKMFDQARQMTRGLLEILRK